LYKQYIVMSRQVFNPAPDWLEAQLTESLPDMHTDEQRMRWLIALARKNIERQTGGPFAAAIFDMNSGKLISAAVNRVEPLNASIAHAEMLAITGAQQVLGSFDLGADGLPSCELVTSSEPCAMCFGALPWSGIRRLVCGARAEDAERIGFDEGPKHPDWIGELERRSIAVQRDVCREQAVAVLNDYVASACTIYNGGKGAE